METSDALVSNRTIFRQKSQDEVLSFRYRIVKRLADLLLICVAAVPCLLVSVPIALLIVLTSRGPIFYREYRIGRGGRKFKIWKFRTMYTGAERTRRLEQADHSELHMRVTHKGNGDPRITPVGILLRRWSLDEIPQVLNVLKGEMSFIGPRPIVEAELQFYGESFEVYCMVKPGLSGLWQVSGRSNTTYVDRVRMDCRYIKGWSLRLDMVILLKTLPVVIKADGAY